MGVMLCKLNKVDYIVKSYRIIRLHNCWRKVYERVVAERLADWYEVHHILYEDEIGSRRQRKTIDTVVQVMEHIQEA